MNKFLFFLVFCLALEISIANPRLQRNCCPSTGCAQQCNNNGNCQTNCNNCQTANCNNCGDCSQVERIVDPLPQPHPVRPVVPSINNTNIFNHTMDLTIGNVVNLTNNVSVPITMHSNTKNYISIVPTSTVMEPDVETNSYIDKNCCLFVKKECDGNNENCYYDKKWECSDICSGKYVEPTTRRPVIVIDPVMPTIRPPIIAINPVMPPPIQPCQIYPVYPRPSPIPIPCTRVPIQPPPFIYQPPRVINCPINLNCPQPVQPPPVVYQPPKVANCPVNVVCPQPVRPPPVIYEPPKVANCRVIVVCPEPVIRPPIIYQPPCSTTTPCNGYQQQLVYPQQPIYQPPINCPYNSPCGFPSYSQYPQPVQYNRKF